MNKGSRHKPSAWSRAKRDRASPQGLRLTLALMLCFALTVVAMILERVAHASKNIVYFALIIAYVAIIAVTMFKISAMNRRAEKARREAYKQKFEGHLQALRARSGSKVPPKPGEKES